MQEFVKTGTSLVEVGRAKIPTYETIDEVCADIAAGKLQPGDAFATVAAHGITEDVMATINCLVSITPGTASPANMLVTQDELDAAGGDIISVDNRVTNLAQEVAQKAACNVVEQIGARVCVNENNISTLQNDVSNLQNNKVNCTDYNDYVTNNDNAISDLQSNRVCCSDYNDTIDTLTKCADFNQYVADNDAVVNCHTNCLNDILQVPTFSINGNTISSDIDTVVANSAENASQCVMNWVSNKNYTTNKGTVTAIHNNSNNTNCNPDANGIVYVNLPTFTLSGTNLYITI